MCQGLTDFRGGEAVGALFDFMKELRRLKVWLFGGLYAALVCLLQQTATAELAISRHAPDVANLSGERGDWIESGKELSRGKAGIGLTIISRGGVSCGVALEGRTLGVNGNFETERYSRCRSGEGYNDEEALELSYRAHMTGLRVCTSRDDPIRIGGFEIVGGEIDDDGQLKRSDESERHSSASCDRWGDESSCDGNFVVTGFVAHFMRKERDSPFPDTLVGLQAVCREVIER